MGVVFVVFCSTFFAFNKAQEYETQTGYQEKKRSDLARKLRAGAQVSADLRTLNESTMDQAASTKLDVLRYMNMQDDDINLNESGQVDRKVGASQITVRNFTLTPNEELTYHNALRLVDRMHNNKRIVVESVSLKAGSGYEDSTAVTIKGKLYGLQKK